MEFISVGDRINCRIKNGLIINPYDNNYDDIYTFDVIGKDSEGYYLYVPHYLYIKYAYIIEPQQCNYLKIHKKFINQNVLFITENMIDKVQSKIDGCFCINCGLFCYMAEPNSYDNSLTCWECKNIYK
jgi:hypothetical protein